LVGRESTATVTTPPSARTTGVLGGTVLDVDVDVDDVEMEVDEVDVEVLEVDVLEVDGVDVDGVAVDELEDLDVGGVDDRDALDVDVDGAADLDTDLSATAAEVAGPTLDPSRAAPRTAALSAVASAR
jgi:hypothetical protein